MKFLMLFYALFCLLLQAAAQVPAGITSKAKIYLVRHAEKDTGNNPNLTPAGYKRAGDLMRTLQYKKIQRIYSTAYRRTMQTGDSLRLLQHIDSIIYKADTTGESVYNKIIAAGDGGKTILIIGHSNTVTKIIRKLGAANFAANDIPDTEFDNLYVVTFKKKKVRVKAVKYGDVVKGKEVQYN